MPYRPRHARLARPVSPQARVGALLTGPRPSVPVGARASDQPPRGRSIPAGARASDQPPRGRSIPAGARASDQPPRGRSIPAGARASDQPPRGRSVWARLARTAAACLLVLRRGAAIATRTRRPRAPGRAGSTRLDRIGTPLLVLGATAFAAALARVGLHAAGRSFVTSMVDLRSFRGAGLIVRHAYHFHSGHPKPLYQWVPPGGTNLFVYPPFAAGIFAALSYVSPLALAWCVTAASFAALIAAIWLTLAGVGVPKSRARVGAALAVSGIALWTQPAQSALGLGQLDLLLMAAIIWDLRPSAGSERAGSQRAARQRAGGEDDHTRTGPWWSGVLTGFAAGVTLTPLIFVPYLLVTRRLRQAAVAAVVFAATVGIGFAVMPGPSASYWQPGLIDRGSGTPRGHAGFLFAAAWNQSLRGYLSRLAGHAHLAVVPWLVAAALTVIIGLTCAALLHRDGYPMLGLLACALAGLLISPVSWVHHWVWVAPWLAAMAAMALLAPRASRWVWLAVGGWITLVFVNWPPLPILTGARHGMNVVADVPVKQPFSWHGPQVFAGNIYLYCGAAGLVALYGWCFVRALWQNDVFALLRRRAAVPWTAPEVETLPSPMSFRE
jgi:alpha-1,2-mannosyltransferase